MHYSLLLLIVVVSVVISSPMNTIITSSRSPTLIKRQADKFCEEGQNSLCCTGPVREDPMGLPYGQTGISGVSGCKRGMYFFFLFIDNLL
jgi:hypothetical protein